MSSRCTFCLLSCLVCLCHYTLTLQWPVNGKQPKSYTYTELTVTGKDLKVCEHQKHICVLDTNDCGSVSAHGNNMFLNTSCRYLFNEKSFGCKWTYLNDVKTKMIHSFIFSRNKGFSHCPSILNLLSGFNLTIKSKDPHRKIERFSEVYSITIENIVQFPRPDVISVNATETSLNVTWIKQWESKKCLVRYKHSTMNEWMEEEDSETFHVIEGLQPLSQYSLTVACIGEYGMLSEWSAEFQAKTLEGVPTAPPNVSYRVESLDNTFRTQKLLLVWKALAINVARGVILGYEVTYASTKQPALAKIITNNLKAELEVAPGDYNVTLMAYNSAGQSPVRHVRINTASYESLPGVKGLWASTEADSLRIRWETETAAVSVSEFAIEWFSLSHAASSQWKRVNGATFSTVLTDSIKQLEIYTINVYPLYESLCGPSESVQASLENGTLLDIVHLRLVNVTKTSVTVRWVWQRKANGTNVLQYRLALSALDESETKFLTVFPHQCQHSFYKLQTNVKYSVSIYGETKSGNFKKTNIEFTTPLYENDEIIKAAVPIVLLIFGFGIFSVLSRTIYKDYFFPSIANPSHSVIGRWLLNPFHEKDTVMRVLQLEDFSLTNQLIEKALMQMEHQKFSEKGVVDEDMMYLPDNSAVENDGAENSEASPSLTEYVDLPLLPDNFGYVENCYIPESTS
ncbi:interleukin-6 receptor subunit beta [Colossoma macropomum]|uniref:interleukin-6 receptor subunit beta n=1 Tax=Colossoma macropomum TaxID=42526 RepID=UPI001863D61A|nr:interleukin-6 receptor subunit beta [Colossoma macropomum]XP_036434382.1 interleukin-6 receptor subunit beta [Colossoma macropomum]